MAEGREGGVADPAAIVEEWQTRAWGECDLDVVDELIAEPFVRHSLNGTAKRSREELKADVREYRKALGKPIIELRDRVVDGDKVWLRTSIRGANLQTGEARTIDRIQIYRIEQGLIAEVWTLHASDVDWDA